jgi:hypothetical protein
VALAETSSLFVSTRNHKEGRRFESPLLQQRGTCEPALGAAIRRASATEKDNPTDVKIAAAATSAASSRFRLSGCSNYPAGLAPSWRLVIVGRPANRPCEPMTCSRVQRNEESRQVVGMRRTSPGRSMHQCRRTAKSSAASAQAPAPTSVDGKFSRLHLYCGHRYARCGLKRGKGGTEPMRFLMKVSLPVPAHERCLLVPVPDFHLGQSPRFANLTEAQTPHNPWPPPPHI